MGVRGRRARRRGSLAARPQRPARLRGGGRALLRRAAALRRADGRRHRPGERAAVGRGREPVHGGARGARHPCRRRARRGGRAARPAGRARSGRRAGPGRAPQGSAPRPGERARHHHRHPHGQRRHGGRWRLLRGGHAPPRWRCGRLRGRRPPRAAQGAHRAGARRAHAPLAHHARSPSAADRLGHRIGPRADPLSLRPPGAPRRDRCTRVLHHSPLHPSAEPARRPRVPHHSPAGPRHRPRLRGRRGGPGLRRRIRRGDRGLEGHPDGRGACRGAGGRLAPDRGGPHRPGDPRRGGALRARPPHPRGEPRGPGVLRARDRGGGSGLVRELGGHPGPRARRQQRHLAAEGGGRHLRLPRGLGAPRRGGGLRGAGLAARRRGRRRARVLLLALPARRTAAVPLARRARDPRGGSHAGALEAHRGRRDARSGGPRGSAGLRLLPHDPGPPGRRQRPGCLA